MIKINSSKVDFTYDSIIPIDYDTMRAIARYRGKGISELTDMDILSFLLCAGNDKAKRVTGKYKVSS